MSQEFVIAVAKGRIFKATTGLLEDVDVLPVDVEAAGRKLILATNQPNIKIIVVRAVDVPTYVRYGAAEIGITGKDVLLESGSDGLYELLDLRIAQCKMMLAELESGLNGGKRSRVKVATKYPNIARNYFADQGRQVEIMKLSGAMEIAPLLGMADQIVDLVDTGKTLRSNKLVEVEHIADISSILIANKGLVKIKSTAVKFFVSRLAEVVA